MQDEVSIDISTRSCTLRALQRGQHPQAVFLHGFAGDIRTWDRVYAALPADFSALRYDLRGFGASEPVAVEPFSHSADLLAILDALNIDRVNLVGLSMGGAVALQFSLEHPQRVDKLVLISPAIVGWEWSEDWVSAWQAISGAARAGNVDKARQLWWQHPLFATTRKSSAADELYRSIQAFPGRQWLRDWQQDSLPDIERLHDLAAETLLLSGDRDVADFLLIAEVIEACVPRLTRIRFPLNGHMLPLEAAAECAASITAFLSAAGR